MKSFKQHIKLDEFGGAGVSKDYSSKVYPSSYRKNKKLLALIDKHNDPLKFILAVLTAMSQGQLNLRRKGVANTREVAALWNDMKSKKISPSLIDHVMSYSPEELLDEGVIRKIKDFFKDTRKKIDITGWKAKVHKGEHPDVKEVAKGGNILFAIDPDTGKEVHIASGNLSTKDIKKFMKMYGLKK